MLRKTAVVQLATALALLMVFLGGCGSGEEESAELKAYVDHLAQLDAKNQRVSDFITRLDQPSYEITRADLDEARQLIADYKAHVEEKKSLEISYRELRLTHEQFLRKLEEAVEQATDTGRELSRERANVAIAMRHIEKNAKLHFKALDVLWLRSDQTGPFPLEWAEPQG